MLEGPGYTEAYQAFLQTVVHLRTLGIAEDRLRELWDIEKKLLQLLHAETTGSQTWFLDSFGVTTNPKKRLLLTNHDVGVVVHGTGMQLGLNFADTTPELFAGKEIGEDALHVLNDYRRLYAHISANVKTELPLVRDAVTWSKSV